MPIVHRFLQYHAQSDTFTIYPRLATKDKIRSLGASYSIIPGTAIEVDEAALNHGWTKPCDDGT